MNKRTQSNIELKVEGFPPAPFLKGFCLINLNPRLVLQHLRENQTNGGDLENLSAKLATIAKEKGSTDNITIIVVLLKPVMEVICPPLVPDQVEGREAPHTHGITSTSSYVFANGDSGPLILVKMFFFVK